MRKRGREGSLGTRYYDEAPAASIEKPAVNIYSSFQLQQKKLLSVKNRLRLMMRLHSVRAVMSFALGLGLS